MSAWFELVGHALKKDSLNSSTLSHTAHVTSIKVAADSQAPSSQPAASAINPEPWSQIDSEFLEMISPVRVLLNQGEISTQEAATAFSDVLHAHLHSHHQLKSSPNTSSHRERAVLRAKVRLTVEKNRLRRSIRSSPIQFLCAVRAHNRLCKATRAQDLSRSTKKQERAFRSNPWKFAKSVCMDGEHQIEPSFTMQAGLQYFQESFNAPHPVYSGLPSWCTDIFKLSLNNQGEPEHCFDLSPITPSIIKHTLSKCPSQSSPGTNGITYRHLKQLPSTHHFLGTLFTKILLQSQLCPLEWCTANIKLIYKEGDPNNFRPIALTSVIGKLFHKILASRLESYCRLNKIIDSSIQKGFLRRINGVMEQIYCVNSMIQHAKDNDLPLALTFIDLKNAFGSVPHRLIMDILSAIKLPSQIQRYISNAYSQLGGSLSTKQWFSPHFRISRGVFQGDTLSPIVFLLPFTPIINYARSLPSKGFSFKIPLPNSEDLPDPQVPIYIYWNEPLSQDPPGWYLGSVQHYNSSGTASIKYCDDQSENNVNLRSLEWIPAAKNHKHFVPLASGPPKPSKKTKFSGKPQNAWSSDHKVKAFADDLTVISSDPAAHQAELLSLDSACLDLGLEIRPDKCTSLHFTGKKMCNKYMVQLMNGQTKPLSEGSIRFLGCAIAISSTETRSTATSKFLKRMTTCLEKIDERPIRGEYKVWIYRFYLV